MKALILVVALSAAILLQASADDGCEKSKVKKATKKYDWCRKNGYKPKLDGCTATGSGDLKKKDEKKCKRAEKNLKKCGYTCDDGVDGGWSDFGDWSECSAECGPGKQTRSKTCSNPAPANGGADCEGDATEVKECLLKECPVDGGWSDFGDWSKCSAECGPGKQTRSKTCSNPAPANGGADCEGDATEVKECLLKECPVDGGWSDFGDWSKCSAECGPGKQTRSKTCSNPAPANGGADCEGDATEVKDCLLKECESDESVQLAITAVWEQIPGGLTRISNGQSGVWGVNKADNIYKLNADGKSWTRISGGLVQVSSGASVWGVNRNDNIYKYLGNNNWQQIPGGLVNIDVSDKDRVWGVNRGQNIYRWTGSNWQQISGKLIQVSVGESGVWGVNAANNIYYRTGTYGDVDTAGSGWQQVPGKLKWISSGSGLVVGVNSANNIYYRAGISADNPVGTNWVRVSGGLMQIEVNKDEVVGTNTANNIYRSPVKAARAADQTVITAVWEQIPGGLTRISNGQSGVWGVNKADNIYKLNADGKSWTRISGGLVQVSSGASVWGVNRNDNIYKYLGNNNWQQIPGGLVNIDVSDKDHVWGVNRGHNIYRWTGSNWQHIAGGLIQVSVGESGVWGVNAANNIYYRTGTYGDVDTAGSGWQQVPGGLKWISSGSGLVVGVNSANNIFYRAGISAANPTGTTWVKVNGGLMQIEVNTDEVVGTNSANNIYRSPVAPAN